MIEELGLQLRGCSELKSSLILRIAVRHLKLVKVVENFQNFMGKIPHGAKGP
jgi:hypothetical protein